MVTVKMNYFKFHPVGQGLFYTGSLANGYYNFVYDCGTVSGKYYLDNAINRYVKEMGHKINEKPNIDFVVISHLHADHFNGIKLLKAKANIKKIYLPYLGNNEDLITLFLAGSIITSVINSEGEYEENIFDSLRFMRSLYGFGERDETETAFIGSQPNRDFEDPEFVYQEELIKMQVNDKDYWSFALINRRFNDGKIFELIEEIHDMLIAYNVDSVLSLIDKVSLKEIAKIYTDIFGTGQNLTSTVLLHYPDFRRSYMQYLRAPNNSLHNYRHYKFYSCICHEDRLIESIMKTTSLLTGDIEINKDVADIIRRINDQFDEAIGVLQIPHHGSWRNYNFMKSESIDAEIYVASYGLGNIYKHPSNRTIGDLHKHNKKYYSSNQFEIFDYCIF